MPTDDEDLEVMETRAHEAAEKQWRRAMEAGPDVDVDDFIRQSRSNHLEAKERGHRHIARFWGVLGDDLAARLRDWDIDECNGIEDAGLVDGIWPDDAAQALDLNDGPDL
jgi:hypothetical protein